MRLITRGDLDGLACAVIISSHEEIDDVLLVHPQEITSGNVEVTSSDILANVPYDYRCGKWFDHHLLTRTNLEPPEDFEGKFGYAPSAAQLVWDYYGNDPRFEHLVAETNRFDSARLKESDVLDPQGLILLGFTIDSRSNLGPFEEYFHQCNEWLKHLPIEAVLAQPEVQRRAELLRERDSEFRQLLQQDSRVDGNVVITDFRDRDPLPIGNRFLVFVLYPNCNVAMRIQWGPGKRFFVVSVGHSIFNRTCKTNVGMLMAEYGGGGHVGAGSTPIPKDGADERFAEMIGALREPTEGEAQDSQS